jgi:hypothetical protein
MTKHPQHQFVEFMFEPEELKAIPRQHSAYIVASSFAINEMMVFLRLMLLTLNSLKLAQGEDERLTGIAFMQYHIILRTVSARVVEYLKLAKDHRTACERAKDVRGMDFFVSHGAVIDALWNHQTTAQALEIRNKLTGHVVLDRIRKTIASMPDESRRIGIYLHEKDGNSVYLLGEDIGHIAAFGTSEEIEAWSDWVQSTCRTVQSLHSAYMIWVLQEFFPEKTGQEIRLRPDPHLLAGLDEPIPILWDFPHGK